LTLNEELDMKKLWRGLLIAALLLGIPALAQDAVLLVPYTNEGYGYEAVVPEGWTDVGQGIFARQSSTGDTTLIAQQSAPLAPGALLEAILPQLNLSEAPESVGTYAGGALEWTLYQVDVSVGTVTVAVDLALAEAGGTTYVVLFQTSPEDYEALHESVFLPTLDAFAPLEVPDEPVPYVEEDVAFENGDVTLAGTLSLPPTDGPHPAVVLVSGSGPQNRDESLGGGIAIKPFRLLADALTRAGIAVLRYDDRGVGESTGTFSTALVQDFASDAEAGIAYLANRDEINGDQIGLLGHSEGGLVAAMLGARNEDLDFIISLAGPGVNGRDVLRLQNQRLMEAEGASQEEIEAQVAFVEELFTVIGDPEAMEALAYERTLEQIEALPEEERESIGDVEAYARRLAEQTAQQYSAGWFESFLNYDPGTDWAQTTAPVLAIFGGKDVQVDAEQNAPALEAALEEAGNEDYEIVILPDANHLFQTADTGGFSEYANLPAEFTPDLVPTILDWLNERVDIAE
jgi:pimeloyl-ACP methyl ester carboxylesterase